MIIPTPATFHRRRPNSWIQTAAIHCTSAAHKVLLITPLPTHAHSIPIPVRPDRLTTPRHMGSASSPSLPGGHLMTPRSWGHDPTRVKRVDRQMTRKRWIGANGPTNVEDGGHDQEERPGRTRGLDEEIIMIGMMDAWHALNDGSLKEGAHRR